MAIAIGPQIIEISILNCYFNHCFNGSGDQSLVLNLSSIWTMSSPVGDCGHPSVKGRAAEIAVTSTTI